MSKHAKPQGGQQGKKTNEQMLRTLERKPDVPDARRDAAFQGAGEKRPAKSPKHAARQSEFPISRGGMHQESRDHNKHNDPRQSGHKPQEANLAQEKP
jgi:hypothetical protein